MIELEVTVPIDAEIEITGDLVVPGLRAGVVVFAHGSGSSRHSTRNQFVARHLQNAGFATLLLDLLTEEEEESERTTRHLRFDIGLLADRLVAARRWLARQALTADAQVGYSGASTGAAAALAAAAREPIGIGAVVSRGGRPDLAGDALEEVRAPTLLIVGGADRTVLHLNQVALGRMTTITELEIVPGAGHLFEETGALERVALLAGQWFERHLTVSVGAEDRPRPT